MQGAKNTLFSLSKDELSRWMDLSYLDENNKFHSLGVENLLKILNTDSETGIKDDDATMETRKRLYGTNEDGRAQKKSESFFSHLIDSLKDFSLLFILILSITSIVLEGIDNSSSGLAEGITIFLVFFSLAIAKAYSSYLNSKKLALLKRMTEESSNQCRVIRDGSTLLPANQLLVGDLVEIVMGEKAAADGVLVKGDVCMDESNFTGEMEPRKKLPLGSEAKANPFILSETICTSGRGFMIVTAVGAQKQIAKISVMLVSDEEPASRREEPEKSHLQLKVELTTSKARKFGSYSYLIIFVALIVYLIVNISTEKFEKMEIAKYIIRSFLSFISILVFSNSNSYDLIITLALALTVKKMLYSNILVRKLNTIEHLAIADEIVLDKSTLTNPWLSVVRVYADGQEISEGGSLLASLKSTESELLKEIISYSLHERFSEGGGNQTEQGLVRYAKSLGVNYQDYFKADKLKRKIPFNSSTKRQVTIYEKSKNIFRVVVHGSSEILLNQVTSYHSSQGNINFEKKKKELGELVTQYQELMLRTIFFAYKDVETKDPNESAETWEENDLDKNLTAFAVFGLKNTIKMQSVEAVNRFRRAGINVRMTTGDNLRMAQIVCQECGIVNHEESTNPKISMEGHQFSNLIGAQQTNLGFQMTNPGGLEEIADQLKVLARARPEDKYNLIAGLKRLGKRVIAVGDGTSDAPAVKEADIGFSNGISSTEVTRESSDMILLDDQIFSITQGLALARHLYEIIKKSLAFGISSSITTCGIYLIGVLRYGETPFNSIQMLWSCIIFLVFGNFLLTREAPDCQAMLQKKSCNYMSRSLWKIITIQTFYQLAILLILLLAGPEIFQVPSSGQNIPWKSASAVHYTIHFHSFVLIQIFNIFNCRISDSGTLNFLKGIASNFLLVIITVLAIGIQVIIVEFGGEYTKTSSLTLAQHGVCFLIGVCSIVVGIFANAIVNCSDSNEGGASSPSHGKGILELRKKRPSDIQRSEWLQLSVSPETNNKYKSIGSEKLLAILHSSLDEGINTHDETITNKRRSIYGINKDIQQQETFLKHLVQSFKDDALLKVAALISACSILLESIYNPESGWVEGLLIFLIIIVTCVVNSLDSFFTRKCFMHFGEPKHVKSVSVVRNSINQNILTDELLVGDIVVVQPGDELPADGFLLSGEVLVDQSKITGENSPAKKTPMDSKDPKNSDFSLISGTVCTEGRGYMVVTVVGQLREIEKIKDLIGESEHEAVGVKIQEKLQDEATSIGKYGLFLCLLISFIYLVHLSLKLFFGNDFYTAATSLYIVRSSLSFVSLMILALPEGLPLAVTIGMAFVIQNMLKDNNLVRKLKALENLIFADEIILDKTGTMTVNTLEVSRVYFGEKIHFARMVDQEAIGKENLDTLAELLCVNTDAIIIKNRMGIVEKQGRQADFSLINFAEKLGYDYHNYRPSPKILKKGTAVKSKKPFSIYQKSDNLHRIIVSGSVDELFPECTKYVSANGVSSLDASKKEFFSQEIKKNFLEKALRTTVLCYRDIQLSKPEDAPQNWPEEELEKDLTLFAILGIEDPLRTNTIDAISSFKRAGIEVRMISGDNKSTCVACAKKCGLMIDSDIENTNEVMEGRNFSEISEEARFLKNSKTINQVLSQLKVLARATPADKHSLVKELQNIKKTVIVVGDGTNDVPAIQAADVGICFGIGGTDMARECSDIILLDDNLNSVVSALLYGRNLFNIVRKSVFFVISGSFAALGLCLIGAIINGEAPFNSVQIMLISTVLSLLANKAFLSESPSADLLDRKPISKSEDIISSSIWKSIIVQIFYQVLVLTFLLLEGPNLFQVRNSFNNYPWSAESGVHYTIIFESFVFLQIFNAFNSGLFEPELKNSFKKLLRRQFLTPLLILLVGQVFITQFFGVATRSAPLSLAQHGICLLIGVSSILAGLLAKILPNRKAAEKEKQD